MEQQSVTHTQVSKVSSSQFNEVALLTLFFCAFFPPAALFSGVISRGQIKRSGERGKSFSMTGIIWGSIFIALIVLLVVIAAASSGDSVRTTHGSRYYY